MSGRVRISIIGAGRVGLAVGMGFVMLGYEVIFVDLDDNVVEMVNNAKSPFYEEGLEEVMKKRREMYRVEKNVVRAIADSEVTFITVNTPTKDDGSIDLSQVVDASTQIGAALKDLDRFHVVVVKSTVSPGTTENVVKPILEEISGKKAFKDFGLAANPEFLREGSSLKDFLNPDRIVIGVNDEKTRELLEKLYSPIPAPKLFVDIKTAEMIKYASNAFLATKISFANEIGNLCKKLGIDSWRVLEGVGLDHRIGPHFLKPGLGWGGPCLPKDMRAIINLFKQYGEKPLILEAVHEVNRRQVDKMIDLLKKHIPNLRGKKIGILGLTYKPYVDDVRETIAYDVIKRLIDEGAQVTVHDPLGMKNFKSMYPDISVLVKFADSPEEILRVAEVIMIVTEWPHYEELDYSGKIVIDGRRIKAAQRTATIYEGLCW